jgi:hypothetical protein
MRFELTHGGCSCDLVPEARDRDRAEVERLRHRYERQGWSPAKIERAVRAAEDSRSKRAQRREETGPQQLFLNAIVEQVCRFGSVRIFEHFYRGSQDDEAVGCSGCRRVCTEELAQGDLPEDVLVEVIA